VFCVDFCTGGYFVIVNGVFNLLEGRSFTERVYPIELKDMAVVAIMYISVAMFLRICRGLTERVKEARLRHRSFWTGIVLINYIASTVGYITAVRNTALTAAEMFITLELIVFLIIRRGNSDIRFENELVEQSMRMTETGIRLMRSQIRTMQNSKKQIEGYLERFNSNDNVLNSVTNESVIAYREGLKQMIENMKYHVFCSDEGINALLNYYAQSIDRQGEKIAFYIEVIPEKEDARRCLNNCMSYLLNVYESALQDRVGRKRSLNEDSIEDTVSLHINYAKGLTMIKFRFSSGIKPMIQKKYLKRIFHDRIVMYKHIKEKGSTGIQLLVEE